MPRRIALAVPALLLSLACDNAKTDSKPAPAPAKADTNKADAEAVAKKADEPKADAKKDAEPKADADTKTDAAQADPAKAEADAKAEEERKAKLAKNLADLEQWKADERTRWTPELEAQVVALIAATPSDPAAALAAVLASPHRLPANVERDEFRHPGQTLEFFGITPSMRVIEIGPGWGWYTEILAPYLAKDGTLLVTDYDPKGPEDQGSTLYARRFEAFRERSPGAYGKIERIVQKDQNLDLGAETNADVVLVVRGLHGWVNRGVFDANVAKLHAALEPGGVAAIVQHRAKAGADPTEVAKQGYLPEAWVIERFEAAGFTLAGKSEVNANPKDTADYPEGVWTLPPTLALGDTDRDKYTAIGESDRMTLRFVKKP